MRGVYVCRERERGRDFILRVREATLKGDSCGSCSGPQRLGPQRKAGLLKRRRMGVLFILTCSTQSLRNASQLRSCSSSAIYMKECSKLFERAGDEHHQIDPGDVGKPLSACVQCFTTTDSQGNAGENTTVLTYVFYLEHKIELHLEIYKSHLRHCITIERKMALKNNIKLLFFF